MGGRGKDARKGERRWWEVKNKKHINQTPITPFPLIPSNIGARTDADASLRTPDRLPPLPPPNHISGCSRRHYNKRPIRKPNCARRLSSASLIAPSVKVFPPRKALFLILAASCTSLCSTSLTPSTSGIFDYSTSSDSATLATSAPRVCPDCNNTAAEIGKNVSHALTIHE